MKQVSMKRYLFQTILYALLGVVVLFLVTNLIITGSIKREYIFHQLEEARDYDNHIVRMENQEFHISEFIFKGEKNNYKILDVDSYGRERQDHTIFKIMIDKFFDENQEDELMVRYRGKAHFYIIEKEEDFFIGYMLVKETGTYLDEFVIVIFIAIVAVFIASHFIAKRLLKPINVLKDYSSEVAKKNWQVEMPKMKHLELSELGHSLECMKNELEKTDREEREFLQATSHDLKTPIMIIKGYAQSMIDGMPVISEELPEEIILHEAVRLERKVKQLMHLNALGFSLEHTENKEQVQVDRILHVLGHKFHDVSGLRINLDLSPLPCYGDGDALLVAFENILENQLRYAKSEINVVIEKRQVSISNDGPPFDIEVSEMFEINKKGKSGQFGLGLAIAQRVIIAHGGLITAYNTENGVCFEINLGAL